MKKYGIFLARVQPIHNAHLYVIEKILEECDYCVIIIGSANKNGTKRNPFPLELRKELVEKSISKLDVNRIIIMYLPDWLTENNVDKLKIWGHYLYYNIVSKIEQKEMTFYYSDNPDYLMSWFDDEVSNCISYRFLERNTIYNNLSATKIREALLNKDVDYLNEFLPKEILPEIDFLSKIISEVYKNPKDDFQM